tara:strand:+ start:10727 stop:10924 length:198 start_codon:yes stop_codon:yes gene_type:complete
LLKNITYVLESEWALATAYTSVRFYVTALASVLSLVAKRPPAPVMAVLAMYVNVMMVVAIAGRVS